MTIYGYTITHTDFLNDGGRIELQSTEPEVIQHFLNILKDTMPSSDLSVDSFSSGKPFRITAKNMNKKRKGRIGLDETYWWIVCNLCQDGWEPFSHEYDSSFFRKVITSTII